MALVRDPYSVLQVARSAELREVRTAYWTLARRYHPDGTEPDPAAMAEVNAAYEAIEAERRAQHEQAAEAGSAGPRPTVTAAWATGPGRPAATTSTSASAFASPAPPPPKGSLLWRLRARQRAETPILDFGQYAGWRIGDIAEVDPAYLRWLSRHSLGVRYQRVIAEVLGSDSEVGRRAAVVG